MSVYLAAYTAAAVCGTAVGAILADRIGYSGVFFLSACLTVLSGLVVFRMLADDGGNRGPVRPVRLADYLAAPRRVSFLVLLLLIAIPGQVLSTGYVFYITTFWLRDLGASQSEVGRVLMCHFATVILFTQLAGTLTDRTGRYEQMVAAGSVLAGLAAILPVFDPNVWTILASVCLIGVGNALAAPGQGALLVDISTNELGHLPSTTVLGMFRLLERIGSVCGPILAALLISSRGYAGTTGLIAAGAAIPALLYFIYTLRSRASRPTGQES